MRMLMMLGREVRRVPMDWDREDPHFAEFYEVALAEWLESKRAWDVGEDPDREKYNAQKSSWEDWSGEPPDPDYYWPGSEWPEGTEMVIQLYETVSEGSPITKVYPDTPEGREVMALEWEAGDSSVTSAMTFQDRHETIYAQLDGAGSPVVATEIGTGIPVRRDDP